MEMKEIALKLCKLPEGEYEIKTKLDIKIQNIRPNERNDIRVVKIFINNELYDEITYSTFDYFHLWEKIYKKNNEQQYTLKREILEDKSEIHYINKNGEVFYINNKGINSYNNSSLAGPSYYVSDGIFSKTGRDTGKMQYVYNIETNEKKLYIRKNNIGTSITDDNSITISGDIYKFITKYNKLINMINKNTIRYSKNQGDNRVEELIEGNLIPSININEVQKLDEELDKYLKIYNEYAPKLNEAHSKEILEVLSMVAKDLDDIFNTPLHNKKSNNKQKMFNLSKYKNK